MDNFVLNFEKSDHKLLCCNLNITKEAEDSIVVRYDYINENSSGDGITNVNCFTTYFKIPKKRTYFV